jgi:hypothetical protein
MKTLLFLVTVAAGLAGAQTVGQRELRQQQRISQGIRSGALTPGEAARLNARERNLRQDVRRDRVDGGAFTPAERAQAQRRLDRLSKDIYRQKHDGHVAPR